MSQAIDPYYFQSRLRDIQNQKAITTGRALSPEDTTDILNSELEARYRGVIMNREQKRADEQLAMQKKAAGQQAKMQEQQGLTNAVSGVGQVALGYAALKSAGVFGTAAATPTTAVPVATATGGYGAIGAGGQTGAAWGGTVGTAGTGGTATAVVGGTEAGAGGIGALGWTAAIVGGALGILGHSEQAASGKSWYGKTIQAGTPWADQRIGEKKGGGVLNIITAPFFPVFLSVGILKQQWDRLFG